MERTGLKFNLWVAFLALGLIAYAQPARSETPQEFFKNNNVEIVVAFSAGGGTDRAARTVSAYWADTFGGTAKINNMPGGGTVVASNYVWKAKPDGLTLYITPFGTALAATTLFGAPGKSFDVSKFNYIAMYADEPPAFGIGKGLPYKSLVELKKAKGLKLGSTSAKGMPPFGDITMLHVLGLEDGKVITGYDSTPEVGLAIKRGEVDGMVFTSSSMMREDKKGVTKTLATVSYSTSPLLPGVKPVSQLLKLTPQQSRILKLYAAAFRSGRVLLGPPGMDPAKVQYLRTKIVELFKSKAYQGLAKSVFGYWEDPLIGKDVEKLIEEVQATPKADVELMNRLAKKYIK
jgi:tripartite-type tricarboxylate transporter receptor subunit TctC